MRAITPLLQYLVYDQRGPGHTRIISGKVCIGAFEYHPAPTVTSIAPSTGPVTGGITVIISGENLVDATATIGGAGCTSPLATQTTVTCITPAGTAGAKDVVVTTPGGTATLTGGFTYIPPPDLSRSSVTVDANILLVGAAATITVTVQDSAGLPINGLPITLNANPALNVTISTPNPAATNASGVATFTVTSTVPQTVTFTASYNPPIGDVTITWQAANGGATGIPTLNEWALLALSLLLGGLLWRTRWRVG